MVSLLTVGCDRSPAEPFARLLEQAASWAASARYASELHHGGQVPDAYLKEVLKTGRQDLQTLSQQITKARAVPQDVRDAALGVTADLQSLLSADTPDSGKLADVEARLRALSRKVRRS